VQGDNLHALKALLPRYAGQVKCIYIDPPYNTGNEGWVYNDNVNSPEIRKWLGEVVGKEGETLDRHDRWLSMMYPALVLLKQFLREDGVIFASIDDGEVHHLRSLLDELFGVKRRLATFVWRTDGNFDNQAKIKNCHEYVLAYAINPDRFPHPNAIDPSVTTTSKLNRAQIQNTIVKNGPKNPISEIVLPIGFPASHRQHRLTAERVKRVVSGYTNAKGKPVEGLGGGFQFCRLSAEPLFDAEGQIRSDVTSPNLPSSSGSPKPAPATKAQARFAAAGRARGPRDLPALQRHPQGQVRRRRQCAHRPGVRCAAEVRRPRK
jgi:hypothetical protein